MKKTLLVFAALVCSLTARSSTIFNTLGPGGTYEPSNGYFVTDSLFGGLSYQTAAQFTALASGNLATIDLGLTYSTLGPVGVYLYSSSGGSPGSDLGLL